MKFTGLSIIIFSLCISNALAKRSDHSAKNKKAAEEYCQLYMETFPGKRCIVDKRVCPKNYVADKKFKGKGINYSACVNGKKMSRMKKVGTRELNRGAAELVNTKNCSVSQIKTLNRVIKFVRDQWSSIKREGQTPTNARVQYFAEAYNEAFKGKGGGKVIASTKQWDRLKKFITGIKSVQIECRSTEWCDKKGVLGMDGIKVRHVNVCVDKIVSQLSEGYLAGNFVHEMAHTSKFPMSKLRKHNCSGKWESDCPRDDATHQIGRVVDFLYMNQSSQRSARKTVAKKRKPKSRCSLK